MYFLDNASTTQCNEQVAEIVKQSLINDYYNPSSKYKLALNIANKISDCKNTILNSLNAINYNLVFTASATEANNLVFNTINIKSGEIIVSQGEHSSVYQSAIKMQNNGAVVKFAKLDSSGKIDEKHFTSLLSAKTNFVSFMLVSNETGAINNAKKLIYLAKKVNPKILVHIDLVQAFCKLPINAEELNADYYTISAHKINGPKGIGALIYKKGVKLSPQIVGGGQEDGKRSGTENYPCIAGFAKAVQIATNDINKNYDLVNNFKQELAQKLISQAKANNINIKINGDLVNSSPYILSLSIVGIKSEILLHKLEEEQIYIGTGSACSSKQQGNRILESMGEPSDVIEGNIRLSFSVSSVNYDTSYLAQTIIQKATQIKRK